MKKKITLALAVFLITCLILGMCACQFEPDAEEITFTINYYDGETLLKTVEAKTVEEVLEYAPQKEGKTFAGWYIDLSLTTDYTLESLLSDDIALYAMYETITYQVVFTDDLGNVLAVDGQAAQTIEYGQSAVAPIVPDKADNIFTGWSVAFTNVRSDLTVRAEYQAINSELVFLMGGTTLFSSKVEPGESLSAYANTVEENMSVPSGFAFDSWYSDAAYNNPINFADNITMPEEGLTAYSKLRILPLTGLNLTADNAAPIYSENLTVGLTASLNTFSAINYAYEWYHTNENGARINGNASTLSLADFDAGSYTVLVKVIASVTGLSAVTATKSVEINVGLADIGNITAQNVELVYDSLLHGITIEGAVAGDTISYSEPQGEFGASLIKYANAGSYTIMYKVERVNHNPFTSQAILTIAKAPLTIIADNKAAVYGDTMPQFTYHCAGFVGSEGISNLDGEAGITCTASSTLSQGAFTIRIGGLTSNNYDTEYVDGTFTISKRPIFITAEDKTTLYGQNAPAYTATYEGFLTGENQSVLTGEIAFECEYEKGKNAGDYNITVSGLSADNYQVNYISGNLFVEKRVLKVTADNQTAYYGEAKPSFTLSYSGFINDDDSSEFTAPPSFLCRYRKGSDAGIYEVVPSGIESINYNMVYYAGKLTVFKVALNIIAEDKVINYGDDAPIYTVSYEGFITGEDQSALTGELVVGSAYQMGNSAGSYAINLSGLASNSYDITFVKGALAVSKVALSVTAEDKSVSYGAAIPSYSVSYSGFVNNDTAANLSGEFTYYCGYVVGSSVGNYSISINNIISNNYVISYFDGSLTVNKTDLTVKADNKNIVYGDFAPIYSASYSGFVAGNDQADLSGSLSITCAYSKGNGAGEYDINTDGLLSDNYNIIFTKGTLNVSKRTITVSVSADFAYNGSSWQQSEWTEITGLYGIDAVAGTLATTSGDIGVYSADGALGATFNWAGFDIVSGSISMASSYNIVYDLHIEIKENNFAYSAAGRTATYDGLAYAIAVSTDFETGLVTYSIDQSSYNLENPTFTQAGVHTVYYKIEDTTGYYSPITGNRKVTIVKAELIVVADSKNAIYGAAAPAFTAQISGYVNGESSAVLSGTLEYNCAYVAGSNVGNYTITPAGLAAANYSMTYVAGNLAVSKAALTVTADAKTAYYGDVSPAYSASYSGLVASDTPAMFNSALFFNSAYGTGSGVGQYSVTPYGLTSSNYSIVYISGTLTVSAKNITVYAQNKTATYGSAAPSFSAASDDLVGNDTIATITGLQFSCSYSVGNSAGAYSITVSGGSSANYVISYNTGALTVNAKNIAITADDLTITYGDAIPVFTITAEGLIAGDTLAGLGAPSFNCIYSPGVVAGTYNVTPYGLTNANYNYNYEAGILTVEAKSVAVVWYGVEGGFQYNGTDQSASVMPGITDIWGDVIYTSKSFNRAFVNAGYYTVIATLVNANYSLTNTVINLQMQKGEYSNITHPVLAGTYSPTKTLADYSLNTGFYWVSASSVPTVPLTAYQAYYNMDANNYNSLSVNITLNLAKALATVTGSVVQSATYSGSSVGLTLGVSFNGSALSSALYTFSYSNGNSFTAAGTYKTTVTINSDNFRVNGTDCYMKVKGVLVGATYYTIEDALNAASSGTVIVTTDTSFADSANSCYSGSGYYTVKSGVELLVPYSNSHSTTKNSINSTSTAIGTKYVMLTVPAGVTITVNGTINVNAVRSHQSTNSMGHVGGNYGQMQLDDGSVINLNSGAMLNSMGFITGTGIINAASGSTVYDVLAIKDFRGGKVSYSIKDDYFAFNQYTMNNIEATLKIYYGASLYCRYYVYTSVATVNSQIIVIGSGAVFQLSSGYISKRVDATNGRTYIDLYGTMTTNSTTLELNSGIPIFGSFSINTADKEFPLSGNYTLTIKAGSTAEIKNRFKFLPGAEFYVDAGATVNVTSSGRLYFFGNGVVYSNGIYEGSANNPAYGGAKCRVNNRLNTITYALSDNARFIVNGTLNMAGYFGGVIETTGTTGVINLTGTLTSTIKGNLNVTDDSPTPKVDYTLDNVSFTAKAYLNGNTSTLATLSQTTYVADPSGTNTWVVQ